ncbi:MAG: TonB family protein [Deltaproteobacteria bacterium]|nr:TonB family protein [Deltaproteobacteria bacterium]
MDRRTESFSPLEAALAKLQQREASLWGRAQMRSHEWLAHLERSLLVRQLSKFRQRPVGFTNLRAEPAIDLDSLVLVSLLLHLFLLFLLMPVTLRPVVPASSEPIKVRLLDLGPPAQEARKKASQKTTPKAQPQTPSVSPPAPTESAEPKLAEPQPAPSLPAPKVLAQAPASKEVGSVGRPAESLIQLPMRSPKAGTSSLATAIDPLPEGLARSRGLLLESGRRAEGSRDRGAERNRQAAPLSSPDFTRYLEMIKKRVEGQWKYPEGIPGKHAVNVLFVLDRGGKLSRFEVLDSTDPRLERSAAQAMREASPFPPIPENLTEHLAGTPLRMKFSIDFGVKFSH